MRVDRVGEVILDETDVIQGLYAGKFDDLSNIIIDNIEIINKFNDARHLNVDRFPGITPYKEYQGSIENFDLENQKQWLMPQFYKDFEIDAYLLELCQSDIELCRDTQYSS